MVKLKTEGGDWLEKEEEINGAFKRFYLDLFSSEGRRDMAEALEFVEEVVSNEDNLRLEKEVTEEEIRMAAFQLNGSKAPGPDGFSGCFYHTAWCEVNEDIGWAI